MRVFGVLGSLAILCGQGMAREAPGGTAEAPSHDVAIIDECQDGSDPRLVPARAMLAALIKAKRFEDVTSVASQLPGCLSADAEVRRLRALGHAGAGDYAAAARELSALLADHPDNDAARFDLGHIYYAADEPRKAADQFRELASSSASLDYRRLARERLDVLKKSRSWVIEGEIGIAPDTNINSATASSDIEIFNLPFRLDQDAQQTSGVGVRVGGNVLKRPRRTRKLDYEGQISGQYTHYFEHGFDYGAISASVGPSLRTGTTERLSLAATHSLQTFGGEVFLTTFGGEMRLDAVEAGGWALSTGLVGKRLNHKMTDNKDGAFLSLRAAALRPLGRGSYVRSEIGVDRVFARARAESYWRPWARLAYARELPGEFSFFVEGSAGYRLSLAQAPAFGAARNEIYASGFLRVSNFRLAWKGYAPYLGLRIVRNWSDIDLYDYERKSIEIGLYKSF